MLVLVEDVHTSLGRRFRAGTSVAEIQKANPDITDPVVKCWRAAGRCTESTPTPAAVVESDDASDQPAKPQAKSGKKTKPATSATA